MFCSCQCKLRWTDIDIEWGNNNDNIDARISRVIHRLYSCIWQSSALFRLPAVTKTRIPSNCYDFIECVYPNQSNHRLGILIFIQSLIVLLWRRVLRDVSYFIISLFVYHIISSILHTEQYSFEAIASMFASNICSNSSDRRVLSNAAPSIWTDLTSNL